MVLYKSLHASISLDGGRGDVHSDTLTDINSDVVKKNAHAIFQRVQLRPSFFLTTANNPLHIRNMIKEIIER